jgi:hypothetical protein
MSLFEQASYHVSAHHAETDESKLGHSTIPFQIRLKPRTTSC